MIIEKDYVTGQEKNIIIKDKDVLTKLAKVNTFKDKINQIENNFVSNKLKNTSFTEVNEVGVTQQQRNQSNQVLTQFSDPKNLIADKRDYLLYVKHSEGKYLTSEDYRVNKVYARILIKNKKL